MAKATRKLDLDNLKDAITWLKHIANNPGKEKENVPSRSTLLRAAFALEISGEAGLENSEEADIVHRYLMQSMGLTGLVAALLYPWLSFKEIAHTMDVAEATVVKKYRLAIKSLDEWVVYRRLRDRKVFDRDRNLSVYFFLQEVKKAKDLGVDLGVGNYSPNNISQHLLDLRVADIDMLPRTHYCLKHNGIVYLGDLASKTKTELLGFRNLGKVSLREIEDILAARGLVLGTDTSAWSAKIQNTIATYNKRNEG